MKVKLKLIGLNYLFNLLCEVIMNISYKYLFLGLLHGLNNQKRTTMSHNILQGYFMNFLLFLII